MDRKHNSRMYWLTYSDNITDDNKYQNFRELVTIPTETSEKLLSSHRMPFYKFIKSDGQAIFVCYDCILYIEEKYNNDD